MSLWVWRPAEVVTSHKYSIESAGESTKYLVGHLISFVMLQ